MRQQEKGRGQTTLKNKMKKNEETATKSTWKNWCPCTTTCNFWGKVENKKIDFECREGIWGGVTKTNKQSKQIITQTNNQPLATLGNIAIFLYTHIAWSRRSWLPKRMKLEVMMAKKMLQKGARVIQLLEEAEKRKKKSTFGAPTSRINPAALYHKLVCCMSARR